MIFAISMFFVFLLGVTFVIDALTPKIPTDKELNEFDKELKIAAVRRANKQENGNYQ